MTTRSADSDRFTRRFRLGAVALGLVALTFVQSPGRVVTDTKLDLVVDPGGFLARALSMWDSVGAFGQVQNQAYGYLFPMGPFFLAGKLASIDPWVVQRLWWSALLVLAFLGMVKLASAMGLGTDLSRIVGGLAYALSPRILTVIGPSSIEVWPMALAPWVLVPLVIGLRRGDPRWMAAASAFAVACVGGVNAVATFAVIPLGALWLLMAAPSPRRRALMLWWPAFVLLGTAWWLIPLFLLGSYSPPFLDYIESASVTTFPATVYDALRGTSDWVPYVDTNSVAGNDLLRSVALIVNGAAVTALGLVGIARRGTPHRAFLLSGVVLGLVLVTLGHTGTVDGWGAASVQQALDGALAPLRNTHKFDLVLRIPLVLGLVHLLAALSGTARARAGRRPSVEPTRSPLALGVTVLACAALLGATVPAWTGQLANRGTFTDVPAYWQEAADWLAARDDGTRALLEPASPFGSYLWGRTGDEVLQPLAESPWAVRNVIPLAPGGNIRTMDVIEQRLATGRGSAGLAAYLQRSGVRFLVVRNDLEPGDQHTDPERVYATLAQTPGVVPVARFGPTLGSARTVETDEGRTVFVNQGVQAQRPAIEIFAVVGAAGGPASTQPLDGTPVVVGGPQALLRADEQGSIAGVNALLVDDLDDGEGPTGPVVLSDADRRQEATFGRVVRNRSASMTADQPYTLERPVHDYVVSPTDRGTSVRRLDGAERITASSSQAWADASGPVVPADQPWSAFDGDPRTSWRAAAGETDSWIVIDLGQPTSAPTATITTGDPPGVSRRIVVTTDAGSVETTAQGGEPTPVALPDGATDAIRVSGRGTLLEPLTIAEVAVDGIDVTRPLVMPRLPEGWDPPRQIQIGVDGSERVGCLPTGSVTTCVAGASQWGEDGRVLDRELALPRAAQYTPELTVTGVGGAGFDDAIQSGRLAAVRASSYLTEEPANSVVRAIDADPRTGWVADPTDEDPTLALSWVGQRRIDRIQLQTSPSLAASAPTEAILRFPDGTEHEVAVDADGVARFPAVRTDRVEVHLRSTDPVGAFGAFGGIDDLPVGVSEVRLPGTGLFPQVPSTQAWGRCGLGPTLEVNGRLLQTRPAGSAADLLSGADMRAEVCGADRLRLSEGANRIRVVGDGVTRPLGLTLGSPEPATAAARADREEWSTDARTLTFGEVDEPTLVTVAENVNAGWRDAEGRASRQVNGWQQGWVVPAGSDRLSIDYEPNSTYRAGLVVGALTFLALFLVLFVRRDPAPAPTPLRRRRHGGVLLAALLLGVGLVAGTAGAVVALGSWALGRALRRRAAADDLAWIAGCVLLVAAIGYAARPWGGSAGWAGELAWPQLLVVASLGVVASLVVPGPRLRPRFLSRIAGRSTTR
ncbi:arabinofuranan 3-O-arabinosyltransferase [Mumia flava]|uniref:Arabinofuranan 3-O-arabinosyltransferase n=1 Tax=Mumia flava TaxID=1348852 RepID=A0A0B2BUV3_9ACTN|nr:alpha-(1->3)-arabinofuranosyltransferase [Mumia flava]PJJ55966.1 arabinofuranan 3-O-arabinosyltransferase [Mumia flava]